MLRRYSATATGALNTIDSSMSKPMLLNSPQRDRRLFVLVLVTNRSGRPFCRRRRTASTAPGTGADPCRMTPSTSRRRAENRDAFAGMAVFYRCRPVATSDVHWWAGRMESRLLGLGRV